MREKRILRATMGVMLVAGAVSAATQWWDASTNSGLQAGTGVWSTVDTFWATNGNPVSGNGPFAWVNGNDAVFTVVATAAVNGVSANSISAQAGDPGVLLSPGAGALTNGAGGIAMTNNFLSISCPIVLGADQTWSVNAAKNQKFDGAVGGPGHLTVRMSGGAYNGTFTLTNAANAFNTFTTYGVGGSPSSYGALTVAAGTLGSSLTLGVPGGSAMNGANLTINGAGSTLTSLNVLTNASPAVLTLAISGTTNLFSAGGLVRLGHATCELTGPNGTNIQASIAGLSLNNNIVAPWMINAGNEFWTVGANGLTNASSASVFSASSSTQYVKIGATVATTNLTASVAAQALNMNNNPINLNGNTLSIGDGTYAGLIARNTLYGSPGVVDFGTSEALIYVNNGQYSTNFCRINGAGGLVKFGNGLLTLASDQAYAGPIWLNNGTLSLNPTAAITYTNTITGPANLAKDGTNAFALSGASIVGSLAVNAGTLAVSGSAQANAVTVNNAGTLAVTGGSLTNMGLTWGGASGGTLIATNGGQLVTPLATGATFTAATSVTLTGTNSGTGQPSTWDMARAALLSLQSSSCILTVDAGAVVSNALAAYIGDSGNGNGVANNNSLKITNGGRVLLLGGMRVGTYPGAGSGSANNNAVMVTGTNPVTGTRSTLDLSNGGLTIGYLGAGSTQVNGNSVTVSGGGVITNIGTLSPNQCGNYTPLTVTTGGQVYCSSMTVGNNANYCTNTVIGTGAIINLSGGGITVGTSAGSSICSYNRLLISGAGAMVTNVGTINTGVKGNSGTIYDNGIVIANGGSLFSTGAASIAAPNGGGPTVYSNVVSVSDPQSLWNAGGAAVTVGNASQGYTLNCQLLVQNGAGVTNVGALTVGSVGARSSNANAMNVTNGSSLASTGTAIIGYAPTVGYLANSNSVTLAGGPAGGALWNLNGASCYLGRSTAAGSSANYNLLTVGTAGAVTNVGSLVIGNTVTNTFGNTATLSGGSLSVSNLLMYLGTNQVVFNSGLLQFKTATVTNSQPFWVGNGGATPAELNLTGGTNANQACSFFNGLVITNNGILSGSGRIVSPTTIAGTLAPGGVGATTSIVFTSNLTLTATAVVKIDLAGKAFNLADQINAAGQTVDLGGATLQVSVAPGYTPARTDVFTNIVAGTVTNSFGNLVGGRVILTQPPATMTISTTGNRVILSGYAPSTGTCVLFL